MFAGTVTDPYGIVAGIHLRVASTLLSRVRLDFETKSRGGVGDDGIKWKPLKRETIAQRRIGKGDLASIGIKGGGKPKGRVRGLLTAAQDKLWRGIFAREKARLQAKFGLDEASASARAASKAWAILKQQGAKTKLEVLGGRQVDILRDTGELLGSLNSGIHDSADGRIMEGVPGRVTVGTNKKTWHHFGTRKLPARPLWPLDGNIPESWWNAMLTQYSQGIAEAVAMIVSGAA
jgi:hypothetical protein